MKNSSPGMKLAISLGLIAVLGPAGIDMYLASMPDMANELNTSYARIQLTLTVFLLAMGLGQLVAGPIVDAYGRRKPLMASLCFYILAAAIAGKANSIELLLGARFVQGLAAAVTLVVAMSTVRDVADGSAAARLFAMLMTIEGLAPVLAPAAGGYLDGHFGWRSVMMVLAVMGVVALVNGLVNLPETLPHNARLSIRPAVIARTYLRIAADASFLLPALALSAVFFFLFIYIGGASLVYQSTYGLTPDTFGLVFGGTGTAVLLGAMTCGKYVVKLGTPTVAVRGAYLMVLGAVLAAMSVGMQFGLPGIAVGMFFAMFGLGMAESALMSMAMASQQTALGYTAALLGCLQLVISSGATPVAGMLAEQGAWNWLVFMALFSFIVLLLVRASAKRTPPELRALVGH